MLWILYQAYKILENQARYARLLFQAPAGRARSLRELGAFGPHGWPSATQERPTGAIGAICMRHLPWWTCRQLPSNGELGLVKLPRMLARGQPQLPWWTCRHLPSNGEPVLIVFDPVQVSQIRDGKSPLSQPALIVSDPVQISQIRDGKSPLSQPALIVSDLVQISQIRDGKSTLSQPFSVTNL